MVTGIFELHRAKIAHNDLRPCNVYYSLERNCYQLAGFGNCMETGGGRSTMDVSQVRTSTVYEAPELRSSTRASLEQADVYALGVTLLSAFYLCEPLNLDKASQQNSRL